MPTPMVGDSFGVETGETLAGVAVTLTEADAFAWIDVKMLRLIVGLSFGVATGVTVVPTAVTEIG